MKKSLYLLTILIGLAFTASQEIDRDKLALDISKADSQNLEELKAFLWKRVAVASVDGEEKLQVNADLSFNENGELDVQIIEASTEVQQKRGIRGKVQANNAQNSMDYVEKALNLSVKYTYMTKGQLIDFFGKADLSVNDGIIKASATDVFVKGDKLTLFIEEDSKLFTHKVFTSFLGEERDPFSGEIKYEKFNSGISHASESTLTLPNKNAVIVAKNKNYSARVQ